MTRVRTRAPLASWTCIVALSWLAACGDSPEPDGEPTRKGSSDRPPNILLVTLDTTRADLFRFAGARNSCAPHIDALAAESIISTQAMAVAPMTQPSHTSMLTGLYPFGHGVHDNGAFRLEDDHVTLAEALSIEGYRTEAFIAATVLHRGTGLDQGFDIYHDLELGRGRNRSMEVERPGQEITDLALSRLETDDERPWFFWVHYFDPHYPYQAPGSPPNAQRIPAYRAEVSFMDEQIGRLVTGLRDRGLWDDTAVVLTADHGEGLGRGRELTHGFLVEDHTMRIPFLTRVPGSATTGMLPMPTSLVDVFATAYAFCGEEVPDSLHGVDLVAAFQRHTEGTATDADRQRAVFFESQHPYHALHWAPLFGLATTEWRYVRGTTDGAEVLGVGAAPTGVAVSDAVLEEARAQFDALTGGADLVATAGRRDLSPHEAARLRSLGYLASSQRDGPPAAVDTLPDPRERYADFLAYEEAFTLTTMGRAAEGVQRLRPLIERYPENPWFRDRFGRVLMASGQLEEGIQQLEKAVELEPELLNSWVYLGRAHLERSQLEDAERCLQTALELFPAHFDAWVQLRRCREAKGDAGPLLLTHLDLLAVAATLGDDEVASKAADQSRAKLASCIAEVRALNDAPAWLSKARERLAALPDALQTEVMVELEQGSTP